MVFQQYSRKLGTRRASAAVVLSVRSQDQRNLPRLDTCTGNLRLAELCHYVLAQTVQVFAEYRDASGGSTLRQGVTLRR
jgi:hypothetical protein